MKLGKKEKDEKIKQTITCSEFLFTWSQNKNHDFTANWKNSRGQRGRLGEKHKLF